MLQPFRGEVPRVHHEGLQKKKPTSSETVRAIFVEKMRSRSERDSIQTMLVDIMNQSIGAILPAEASAEEKQHARKDVATHLLEEVSSAFSHLDANALAYLFQWIARHAPESKDVVARKALLMLKEAPDAEMYKASFAITLVRDSHKSFAELGDFGFSVRKQLEVASQIVNEQKENIFDFLNGVGILTDAYAREVLQILPLKYNEYAEFYQLSADEVRDLLQEVMDLNNEEDARESLGVPTRNWGDWISTAQEEYNEFERIYPIDVRRFSQAEDALQDSLDNLLWLHGESLERRAQISEKKARLQGDIFRMADLQVGSAVTSAAPLFVYFKEKDVLPAVCKLQARDSEEEGENRNVPAGTHIQREWLAYQIDQALQIGTTPTTILRETPLGVAMVQEWVPVSIARNADYLDRVAKKDQVELIALDDVVKVNSDRHYGNILGGYDGAVYSIDHGLIFAKEPFPSRAVAHFDQQPPSEQVQNRIRDFRSAPVLVKALRACFDVALEDSAEAAWEMFEKGMDSLLTKDGIAGKFQG